VCFEPLEANAQQIRRNAELNGFDCVQIHRLALGSADGQAEFLASESPTWGRLASAGATPLPTILEKVPVRKLDSLDEAHEIPIPQFIKMDVEGAEAEVILGGKGLIGRSRPLMVIELHHTYQAVIAALEGLDYAVRPL